MLSGSEVSDVSVLMLSAEVLDELEELPPAPLLDDDVVLLDELNDELDKLEEDEYISVLDIAPLGSITISEGPLLLHPIHIISIASANAKRLSLFPMITIPFQCR